MPDKRITELPSMTEATNSTLFPVEQGGVAKKATFEALKNFAQDGVSGAIVVTAEYSDSDMVASMSAGEIYEIVSAGKSVVLRLYNQISETSVLYTDVPLYTALNAAATFMSVGLDALTAFVVDAENRITQSDFHLILADQVNTISGNGRLLLDYEPTDAKHAANKAYVDAKYNIITAGVQSVNGMTGDVVIPVTSITAMSLEHGAMYTFDIGGVQTSISIPNYTEAIPVVVRYYESTDTFEGSYSRINAAAQNGLTVRCIIEDTDYTEYVNLTSKNTQGSTPYYSFVDSGGHTLSVFEDGTYRYD